MDDDEAASALASTPAAPLAINANEDYSSGDDPYADDNDDDDDDDDSDEDPFANLSRFQSDRRRKLLQANYDSSEEEEDSDDDSDSGSKKPAATDIDRNGNGSVKKPLALSTSSPTAGSKRKATTTTTATTKDDCCEEEVISLPSSTFSDDDIDMEIESITTKKTATTTTSTKATTAPKRITRSSAKLQPPSGDTRDPCVRAASNAALEEARRAREALKAAQSYKAKEEEEDDDDVEVVSLPPSPVPIPTSFAHQTTLTTAAPTTAPAIQYTGATLRLTLRYRHPTTKKDCTTNTKLKADQPFQHAVDEFQMQFRGHKVGLKIVCATFDGRKLDFSQSPTLYDMEDEDLIDADVIVDGNPPPAPPSMAPAASSLVRMPPPPAAATPIFVGATLRLTLRYQHPMTKKTCTTNIKLKSDQPLQYAVIEFEMQHHGSHLRISSAIFDGRKLDTSKTPAFYEMEDEDLVDIDVTVVSTSSAPVLAAEAAPAPPAARPQPSANVAAIYSGTNLRLTFRYQHPTTKKDCSTNVKLKSDQPLQDAVKEFEERHRSSGLRISNAIFDGRKLELSKTPKFYEMEDEDLIDVSLLERNNAAPIPQPGSILGSTNNNMAASAVMMPRSAGVGGAQSAKVTVTFRINSKSSDIVSFTQDPKNMFALQMNLLCRARGIAPEQCKWKLGGRALCPRTTPESVGVTSGEIIIDVTVSKSKVATSRAAERAAKAITAAGRGSSRRGRR